MISVGFNRNGFSEGGGVRHVVIYAYYREPTKSFRRTLHFCFTPLVLIAVTVLDDEILVYFVTLGCWKEKNLLFCLLVKWQIFGCYKCCGYSNVTLFISCSTDIRWHKSETAKVLMLVFWLAALYGPKMETPCFSEMLVSVHKSMWLYYPADQH
jgi:hypothetical protein